MFTERELLPDFVHFILVDSVETLDFMIAPYKEDSIRLTCFYPPVDNMPLFTDTVRLDRHKILMETYTPGDGFDIPIIVIPLVFRCKVESGFVDYVIQK